MPKKLKTEKLPIIGFFNNSSVICLWNVTNLWIHGMVRMFELNKTKKRFLFVPGKFGKDLFIDFLLPKPTIVASSTDVTSLNGAVYDLVKIMSEKKNRSMTLIKINRKILV
uniref:Uncharacterized protein n=1 Tax=Panagrolaimus davidi TaxID=227884 RepID=A0A914QZ79_9BILA